MNQATNRRQHLFVVRTWRESNRVAPIDQWRGSVEHVPSGQRAYFTQVTDLNLFLCACMRQDLDPGAFAQLQQMFPDIHTSLDVNDEDAEGSSAA